MFKGGKVICAVELCALTFHGNSMKLNTTLCTTLQLLLGFHCEIGLGYV